MSCSSGMAECGEKGRGLSLVRADLQGGLSSQGRCSLAAGEKVILWAVLALKV